MLFVKPTYNTFIFGTKGVDNEKENSKNTSKHKKEKCDMHTINFRLWVYIRISKSKKTLTCGSSVHLRKMKMLDMWEVANIETIF
jgi:hypothetical protein